MIQSLTRHSELHLCVVRLEDHNRVAITAKPITIGHPEALLDGTQCDDVGDACIVGPYFLLQWENR